MTVSEATETPWEHLHPGSVLVNLLPRTWALARNLWPLLLALWFGGRAQVGEAIGNTLLLLVFFATALGGTLLHALTLRYRVHEGKLEIRSGLLNRQARVLPVERIQNVERVQNLFHRLSGLVEVRIETASGTEVEGLLSAIDTLKADELTAALTSRKPRDEAPPPEVIVGGSIADLAWAGAADLRLGALGVLLAAALELLPQFGGEQVGVLADLPALAWLAVAVAVVSGSWLLGIAAAILRYYGFTLSRTERGLLAEQGLFTKRRAELRPEKVQLLSMVEPVLMRLVGFGSLQIETAAAPIGGSGTERGEIVVPSVHSEQLAPLCVAILGREIPDPAALALSRPHAGARTRAWVFATARSLLLGTLALSVLGPYGAIVLLMLPLDWALAALDVASMGYTITDDLVIVRRGAFTRVTRMLPRSKLQSAALYQGPLSSVLGIGILSLRVAGSRVELPPLALSQAQLLQRELLMIRASSRAYGSAPPIPG